MVLFNRSAFIAREPVNRINYTCRTQIMGDYEALSNTSLKKTKSLETSENYPQK